MSNLYEAHRQWASRPDDERFWTLEEMLESARQRYRDSRYTAEPIALRNLEIQAVPIADETVPDASLGDLQIVYRREDGNAGAPAVFTDYSFRQLANRVGAPTKWMRSVSADLAAQNFNWGLARMSQDATAYPLFQRNGQRVMRSITSEVYNRIWNYEVIENLIEFQRNDPNWRTPPARPAQTGRTRLATAEDVQDSLGNALSLTVKERDPIGPAGLYESGKDMFAFLINASRVIEVGGEKLIRGFYARNSEVGDGSLKIFFFLLQGVCGNHICWNTRVLGEVSLPHIGSKLRVKLGEAYEQIKAAADVPESEDVARIQAAKKLILGANSEDVVELVTTKSRKVPNPIGHAEAEAAYAMAEEHADTHGAPNSLWGFVSGLTRISQQTTHADKRNDLDRAAGKLLMLSA